MLWPMPFFLCINKMLLNGASNNKTVFKTVTLRQDSVFIDAHEWVVTGNRLEERKLAIH